MTGSRRQRNLARQSLAWLLAAAGAAALILLAAFAIPAPVTAATTERVITDFHTGLAISGFDPVAYFTDSEPKLGSDDLELTSEGVTWRFRNAGNRAAFAADPDVYRPRFGGYDPVAVARGVGTAGHPELWRVYGGRLYLFYSAKGREAFAADPEAVIEAADANWPAVLRTLVP